MLLNENEQIDDLQCKGLKLIQRAGGFRFGIDAVLLANFAKTAKASKIVDLGTGTGIIPVLLAGKTKAEHITGIEILPEIAEMAKRSVALNKLEKRVEILNMDLKDSAGFLGFEYADMVVSNPPYVNAGCGLLNDSGDRSVARHEIMCTLDDVVMAASNLLKNKGQFNIIHRPERLVDVICAMRKHNIEPKQMQLIYPGEGKSPNLVLIRGFKAGNPQIKVLEPLYIYNRDGSYSEKYLHMVGDI
ncbi:MAG: tRNA1(Val) (adenine(37)-N6)-methyltransferase [Eubacteriales bacterium]|nr:tRNA1(Val) (adenine(37)-N6)-methyltransferase [Eubacteriales bacterium]